MGMNQKQIVEGCTLEIDSNRGVLYLHDKNGCTILRMSGLPKPVADIYAEGEKIPDHILDVAITPGYGWNYQVQFSWFGNLLDRLRAI